MWLLIFVAIFALAGIRKIPVKSIGVVIQNGHRSNRIFKPGFAWIIPVFQSIECISMEPFSVSLPPQSAITSDEIPIQLQASLNATVLDPALTLKVKDWRIFLMSRLQQSMKDQLEEVEFEELQNVFPEWIQSIRSQLEASASEVGVNIDRLEIANLSPKTRPAP